MTSQPSSARSPLEDKEWDFDSFRDKSPAIQRGVFIYEYFRQSRKLKGLIRKLRRKRPKTAFFLEFYERESLRQETGGGRFFCWMVEALMNCRKFPRATASDLNKDVNWLSQLEGGRGIRVAHEVFDKKRLPLVEGIKLALAVPGVACALNGRFLPKEYESLIPMVVDWRKSDADLVKAFQSVVLKLRHTKFKLVKASPAVQSSIGDLCDSLPFKPLTALNWLGVLRRAISLKNDWKAYLDLYGPPKTKERIETGEIEFSNWQKERLKERDRANLLLEWFEHGATGSLSQADFQ